MDSSSILPLIGHHVLDAGEVVANSTWAQQVYEKVADVSQNLSTDPTVTNNIKDLRSDIEDTFGTSSTESFQAQLPLSPSDAPTVQPVQTSPSLSTGQTNGNAGSVSQPSSPSVATSTSSTHSSTQTSTQNQTQSSPPASQPVSQSVTQDASGLAAPFNTILGSTEDAVVNILCTSQSGNLITVSTGSGVIVDPRGIILTNAHVAQDLLFTDPSNPPVKDCTVRQGHLISSLYKVSVLYIPLTWAQANKGLDEDQSPEGTGQGDYALLAITKSATGDPMPSSFPYISPVTAYRDPTGENVLAVAYPAESVQGNIEAGVPEKYAQTDIQMTFTLDGTGADVFQTGTNAVAQRGSSGGAVIDKNGDLLGLIVSVQNPSIASGAEALEAISVPYIFQNLNSAGVFLSAYAANPSSAVQNFAATGVTIRDLVQ